MKHVYFIRPVGMEGPVKIGCSEWPENRLAVLMAWSPFPLEIVAFVEGDGWVERRFHGMFEQDHTHKEWFRQSARLSAVIARLAAGEPLSSVLDMSAKLADFRSYSWRLKQTQTVGAKKLIDDRGGCRAIAAALEWPYTTVHTFHRTNKAPQYRWQAIAALPVQRKTKAPARSGAVAA